MIIVKPSAVLKLPATKEDAVKQLRLIEEAARVCYKSEDKMGEEPNLPFIRDKIDRGHETVIQHSQMTFHIVCDRGVSLELVRHRIAAYCQESTRFCSYNKDKFGNEMAVVMPCFWDPDVYPECMGEYLMWESAMKDAENAYMYLLQYGASPQEARSVLPNSLKTEVFATMNLSSWRNFFRQRTAMAAHPQMREIALIMLEKAKEMFPLIFDEYGSQEGE